MYFKYPFSNVVYLLYFSEMLENLQIAKITKEQKKTETTT